MDYTVKPGQGVKGAVVRGGRQLMKPKMMAQHLEA